MKPRFFFLLAVFFTPISAFAADTVTLRGTVTDESGKPVAGAQVYLEEDVLTPEKIRSTGSDGRFELPVPSDKINEWMSVYAVSPDKTSLGTGRPKLKEGSAKIPEMTITLKKARIITGTVVDAEGKPVEGTLVGGVDQTPYPNFTKTDADGRFRFAYPKDDTDPMQQVFAYHEKFGLDFLCTEELEKYRGKIPPEKRSDGPFHFKLIGFQSVRIRVVDESKTPLPGVDVTCWLIGKEGQPNRLNMGPFSYRLKAVTDEQGIASVTLVPKEIKKITYFVARAPKEGLLMPDGSRQRFGSSDKRWQDFDESEPVPTLVLQKKGNVRGTVKRSDGTPVAWTRITVKRHNACGHGIVWSNAQGEFTFDWGKPGELFDIGAESTLGAAPGVFAFNVGDGIKEKRLDFVLEKGIRLHGTVFHPDGTPSEKYQISFNEKCPEDVLKKIQESLLPTKTADTCPPDGCPEGVIIRQTSDYFDPGSQGKYEYFLLAAARKYDFSVFSYADPELKFEKKDFQVKGDEPEIRLDFHLKKREKE